jgi:hypothetical protein
VKEEAQVKEERTRKLTNRSLCGTQGTTTQPMNKDGPIVKRVRTHALSLFFGHILVSFFVSF